MTVRRLFPLFLMLVAFNVSARDERLVFHSAREDHTNTQIYIMSADGDQQFRMTHGTGSDVDPDMSPDGEQMLFTSNQTANGRNDIFLRDRDGVVHNLTNHPAYDYDPDVAQPHGGTLVDLAMQAKSIPWPPSTPRKPRDRLRSICQ